MMVAQWFVLSTRKTKKDAHFSLLSKFFEIMVINRVDIENKFENSALKS